MKKQTKLEIGKSLMQLANLVLAVLALPAFQEILETGDLKILGYLTIALAVWLILQLIAIAFINSSEE